MIVRTFLAVFLSLSAVAPAAAQDSLPPPADVDALKTCVAEAEDDPTICIGHLADRCQDEPDGSTTMGIGECLLAEETAWDVILNERYRAAVETARDTDARLAETGISDVRESLVAAQRAWLAFRDAECDRLYALNQEGTIRTIVYADCRLGMTARRAIDLAPEDN